MSNLLEVNSLNVQFNYDETTVQAVKNVSFELRKKHILVLLVNQDQEKVLPLNLF